MQPTASIQHGSWHAPAGVLVYDAARDRVQCHLCGGWFRALAPRHLSLHHRLSAREYRVLAGLDANVPLVTRSVSATHARDLAGHDTREYARRRAATLRACRESRAQALGFDTLESYYIERYFERRVSTRELARELGCGRGAVKVDLAQLAAELFDDSRPDQLSDG